MVPRLVLGCLLFALSSGNSFESDSGKSIDKKEFPVPYYSQKVFSIWPRVVNQIALDENLIKMTFDTLNVPSYHRYFLDIVLLIGNLDIPDEGYEPYFKREDGIAALRPVIEKMKGFTEPPRDRQENRFKLGNGTPIIDPFSLYIMANGEHIVASGQPPPDHKHKDPRNEHDDKEDSQPMDPKTDSSTEFMIYKSAESGDDVPDLTVLRIEYPKAKDHESSEFSSRDSGEFEYRYGQFWDHSSHHTGSSEESEEEPVEFHHRVGLRSPSKSDLDSSEEDSYESSEEDELLKLIGWHKYAGPSFESLQVGSIRGIAGVHFPDYREIPITAFSCADKDYIPGFYADLETGCQVFHVCWPHRKESFLCPVGTTFNQVILACDYWYSTNCSLSHHFFDVNVDFQETGSSTPIYDNIEKPVSPLPVVYPPESPPLIKWSQMLEFFPVKSKVVYYPKSDHSPTVNKLKEEESKIHFKASELASKVKGKPAKKAVASGIVKEVLLAATNIAKNVQPSLPRVASVGYLPEKSVRGIKGKRVPKSVPIPKVVPEFVVPVSVKGPRVIQKPSRVGVTVPVMEDSASQESGPVTSYKIKTDSPPGDASEVVMGALEMASAVLSEDILPFTRRAIIANYVKHAKSKRL